MTSIRRTPITKNLAGQPGPNSLQGRNPGQQFSDDFASGFAEGYADYLDGGGTTAPPALPPRSYWANRDCRQAAVDWLDGFHAGAQLARSTGLRQVIVVPTVSAINCGAVPVYSACCAPMNTPAPNSPFVPETVPAPAPKNEPPAVPAPSSLPAAPAPPRQTSLIPESLPTAPMPPQTSAADRFGMAGQLPMVPPAYPPAADEVRVEIYPVGACLFNDNGPAYPENVNPLSTHEITGCSMNPGNMSNQPQSEFSMHRTASLWAAGLALLCLAASGCAAITNPLANAIPVCDVPPELLNAPTRGGMVTVPLTLLKQKAPEIYRLAANDVLGIYIEGVLPASSPNQPLTNPPIYFPAQLDPMARGLPAAMGFPINIRDDGTISLPLVNPIHVSGMSVAEADKAIHDAYIDAQILIRGRERIVVTLMQPRTTRVTVIRQEFGGFTSGPGGFVATTNKRGSGNVVNLRAYENDVLSALSETGGLASLEDYSEVVVFKHGATAPLEASLAALPPGKHAEGLFSMCPRTIVIPTRLCPGQPMPFKPEDIVLEDGDVVFLEARDTQLFYTGGLLPPTEQTLPRDYDLDVVTAIMKVQGSLLNGGFGISGSAGGVLVQPGLGNPSPSQLTVLRRTNDGGQLAIRVDLNKARSPIRASGSASSRATC